MVTLAAGSGVFWWFSSASGDSMLSAGLLPRGTATLGAVVREPPASEAFAEVME